jgi:CelD/BcsL family acetyltransferase involved in cellulose biosynthesis
MTVVCEVGPGALGRLAADWQALEATGDGPLFSGFDWAAAAVAAFGAQPYLVGVRHEGALVALWPLERRGPFIRPLAGALADVTAPLVHPGHLDAAARALVSALPAGTVLDLPEAPVGSPWAVTVPGWRAVRRPASVRLFLPLDGGPERVEAALRPSTRKKLRYEWRRLAREGWRLERVLGASVPAVMDELFRLHTARWRRRAMPGSFFSARRRRFHLDLAGRLAASGRLGLFALERDGQRIAVLYGFIWKGAFLYYASGFDLAWARWSPGMALLYAVIGWSAAAGLHRFDFLRGEEPYKDRFPCEREENVRLMASRGGLPAAVLVPVWSGTTHLLNRMKRTVERSGGG